MNSQCLVWIFVFSLANFCQTNATSKRNAPGKSPATNSKGGQEDVTDISEMEKPQLEAISNASSDRPPITISFGVLPERLRRIRAPPTNRKIPYNPLHRTNDPATERLPTRYNAADVYGRQCPSFKHIMYQGKCSNCWAVATISMINDRVCMYKKRNERQKFYSAKYLTTCLPKGCDGGWFSTSLQHWISSGIVEGGDYRTNQPGGCAPYPLFTSSLKYQSCQETCKDGTEISEGIKSYGGARYEIKSGNAEEIMREIYLYGPVIATFDVYDDLAHRYERGVYTRSRYSPKLGGHAAKIYGWGVEDRVPFWYAANSWGKEWGNGGFFKIRRGKNECNIESNIHAAVPFEGLIMNSRKRKERN